MTRPLLIEPHLDDAALFASYTLLREQPMVATCLCDTPDGMTRMNEHWRAMGILGCFSRYLQQPERRPDWRTVERWMVSLRDEGAEPPPHVFLPAWEEGGHEQHNVVDEIGTRVFDGLPITRYMTYRRGHGRSHTASEVVPEPEWPALKLRAMAQYASQINRAATRPWFAAGDMLREWYK